MKPILFRAAFLFFGALIQVSFSNTVFISPIVPPPILLAMVVSITLFRGFSFSWVWVILAGFFLDAITLGRLGHASVEFVLLAALLSFTAKEVIFEYHAGRILFLGGLFWIFEGAFRLIEIFLFSLMSEDALSFSAFFSGVHWSTLPISLIVAMGVCALILPITFSFERYLDLFERTKVGRR